MAIFEQIFIDGLSVVLSGDTAAVLQLEELNMNPPKQRQEWISAADSEGAALMRNSRHENREITAKVRVSQQATTDLAFDKIGTLVDKLAKASQSPNGIVLDYIPSDSARLVKFDCLAGEIEELPIDWNGSGWFQRRPSFTVKMTCRPYFREAEYLASTSSGSSPTLIATISGVMGDVPALGRLVVTDTATQNRRFVEWGLQPVATADTTLLDSDSMVVSGYAGAFSTVTGAYDANASGNNAISATLLNQPVAVAGTGNLAHSGTWRVRARVNVTSLASGSEDVDKTYVRFVYRSGDGVFAANPWTAMHLAKLSAWQEVDLGIITVPAAIAGAQRWSGRVDAYNSSVTGTFVLDYLKFIPTDGGWGKARTVRPSGGSEVINGYDQFTGTTAGGALNARSAPAGGSWVTAGATTDFTFSDTMFGATTENVTRATTADSGGPLGRSAVLGTTNYTNVEAYVTSYVGAKPLATYNWGTIARWTDASNYLHAYYDPRLQTLYLAQIVASTRTVLASKSVVAGPLGYLRVRLVVYASGQAYAYLEVWDGTKHTESLGLTASTSVLATGGTLATGKPGFHDSNTSASNGARYYDDFYVGTPPSEQITIASGQSLEIRHDDVIREDSGGTVYGRPASYRGTRFVMPAEGTDANDSRVVVHAHRNDIDTDEHTPLGDALQVQVYLQQRGLVVPR